MEECCKAINGVDRPSFCSIKARWFKNDIVSLPKVVKRFNTIFFYRVVKKSL